MNTNTLQKNLYLRIMTFLKPYLLLFFASLLMSMVIVTLETASMWFMSTFPSLLFGHEKIQVVKPEFSIMNINAILKYWTYSIMIKDSGSSSIIIICVVIVAVFALKNLLSYINNMTLMIIHGNVAKDIRNTVFDQILDLPISRHDAVDSSKTISLMINDVTQINTTVTQTLLSIILEPVRLTVFLILLIAINWKLTLIVFLMYPILGFIIVKIGKAIKRRYGRELQSFSDLMGVLTESVVGIRVVKMFNALQYESDKFKDVNSRYIKNFIHSERVRQLGSPIAEMLGVIVAVSLLLVGGQMVMTGNANFQADDFIRFLVILLASYQPIKKLTGINSTIQNGLAAAERVFSELDSSKESVDRSDRRSIDLKDQISFSNVNFHYPNYTEMVLKNVSFSVKKGQTVAIVGPSGAGKSTILDLIPRFYDVTSGEILIDQTPITDFQLSELRNSFSIVSQDNVLFNCSVADNIAYGSSEYNMDDIVKYAQMANAHEFISELPDTYKTVIGERGITLSGGQKQRLAIARALYHNAPILILDEATSALDSKSEKMVQNAVETLMSSKTSFVVAHRLSTVKNADCILVIESGEIVESGTFEELLNLNGAFKKLHDIQFSYENSGE